MSRKSPAAAKQPSIPIITLKVDASLRERLLAAVKKTDTDVSKFSRAAIREKLQRMKS